MASNRKSKNTAPKNKSRASSNLKGIREACQGLSSHLNDFEKKGANISNTRPMDQPLVTPTPTRAQPFESERMDELKDLLDKLS